LRVACALELWQEAYRSIEDIHGLVQLSKKTPKAALMATYFEKLAQIFWVSGNHLFHAYALFRFYTFSLLSANSAAAAAAAAASAGGPGAAAAPSAASASAAANEAAERTRLASRLLLSALVIPQRSAAPGDEVCVRLGALCFDRVLALLFCLGYNDESILISYPCPIQSMWTP
jgi:hypothetical protein